MTQNRRPDNAYDDVTAKADSSNVESSDDQPNPYHQFVASLTAWRLRWSNGKPGWLSRCVDVARLIVEIVTLAAVVAAGYYAWKSWTSLAESNRIARDSFTASQRPGLGPEQAEPAERDDN